MKKTQLLKYKKRYLRIKKSFKNHSALNNPHYSKLLQTADMSLKRINQKSLAEETRVLLQKQLDLVLTDLERKIKES